MSKPILNENEVIIGKGALKTKYHYVLNMLTGDTRRIKRDEDNIDSSASGNTTTTG